VVGIANAESIAYGCAVKLRAFGADLAVTYLNEGVLSRYGVARTCEANRRWL
jgi:enoyl-[acyl-carrier-protein] reductase (NADH)